MHKGKSVKQMAEANFDLSKTAAQTPERCFQTLIDCDLCEGTTDVIWRCVTCPANICAKCKAIHGSRTTFKHHKMIQRTIHRSLSPRNIIHLKHINIECQKLGEIHRIGNTILIEFLQDSKWQISTLNEFGDLENPTKFEFSTHGFAVSQCGTIFICDIHNESMWRLSRNGHLMVFVDTSPNKPWGVCLNSDGNIVVCLKNSIGIYSRDDGRQILTVSKTDAKGDQLFGWSYKIFQDKNQNYCLLDWDGRHSVIGFDELFNLQWNYKSNNPRSDVALAICGDPFCNVLIEYYYGTIEILDNKGKFLMMFDTCTTCPCCPQQLLVDQNNILWVVKEYRRTISFYMYM